ncbi:MAG: DUF3352 domain-containing protein [Gomphosphaeria aponina SAG 52.96 = DSM 107014]|uniref:DUF3352 domain-containing protein n=1 Tax=Gomphosphaeria aponina SAG 52.96 = DSM 107014 TaxID=1521640 RepID=A0A941GWX5_9CHRO|nr:DUF3352 domain-containing protein [Gomphosphaeria aponina SAG 52.96 = DSM 107014]
MKLRSFFLPAFVVVLIIAVVGGYLLFGKSSLNRSSGGVMTEPSAAIFVPRQAPAMLSLLVNPDSLEGFGRSPLDLKSLKNSLFAQSGLDYNNNIKPWLGDEVTLALTSLDYDREPENGVQPGYLLVVQTKDVELAKEELQLWYSKRAIAGNSDLVFEQYKGVNLIYQRPKETDYAGTIGVSAVVGDFVIFANHPKVLRDAINNVQAADLNLQNSPAYQDALSTITEPRIGVAYLNIPGVSAWIGNSPSLANLEVREMLTIALTLKGKGLAAATALIGVAGIENQSPSLSAPVRALNYIPGQSILTAAGSNLNQFWRQVESGLKPESPLQQVLNQAISRVNQLYQIDLPEEIFSWVTREYAFSLLPLRDGKLDWVFVAEKSGASDAGVAHLDLLAKERGLSVGGLPLLEQEMIAWTKLQTVREQVGKKGSLVSLDARISGIHTQVENYEILSSSLEGMAAALGEEVSLLAVPQFVEAIAVLPDANDGYLYVDWLASKPIFEAKFPLLRVVELVGKPLFENLRSVTITSQGVSNNVRRATIFFDLQA